ncbi:MAG: stage IV sporulation protein A [Ruminococcaceae bacterium]|nr:stage IV sporulation protein A [Oscillospiraceae bacterium]
MATASIYQDIAERTGGDIYIGVVGPVRSGKSTFITRFMNELVLPHISDTYSRDRARDEMPQSAAGMTVMTTEPKFVPDEGVAVTLEEGTSLRVKMIDCVGYMVQGVLGGEENGAQRMVKTPWSEEPMPFGEAAELGTRRVMTEHATIGLVVTSDGTIGTLARSAYEEAEARIIEEMKALGKPFAVVLNSASPADDEAVQLAAGLEKRYGVPVALVNCLALNAKDITGVLNLVLGEFPVTSVGVRFPSWWQALDATHPVRKDTTEAVCRVLSGIERMGGVGAAFEELFEHELVEGVRISTLDMGTGRAEVEVKLCQTLYYQLLSDMAGQSIENEGAVFALMRELCEVRKKYVRVADALESAEKEGYGIVMPTLEDLHLESPTIVKQSGGFGVRLRATARSIHMLRADIAAEINPIVGTEQQSEEFLRSMIADLERDPQSLWHSNMFGKSLYELVNDSLCGKLAHMPTDARHKLSETLERIINDGANGLICLLL